MFMILYPVLDDDRCNCLSSLQKRTNPSLTRVCNSLKNLEVRIDNYGKNLSLSLM